MLRASILAMLAAVLMTASAPAVDLHQFWDSRCADCHGHAGPFARKHLKVEGGVLKGHKADRDLKLFLAQHETGEAMATAVYTMLLAQAQTQPVYQQKCAGCHETAAAFARQSLVMRNGVLTGRDNGRPVAEFLKRHGKLTPDEIPVVVEALTRVLAETQGGAAKK